MNIDLGVAGLTDCFLNDGTRMTLCNDGTRIWNYDLTEDAGSAPCGRSDLSTAPSRIL
jgi:hypothetical protein